jgi:hypothetical protein
MGRASPPLRYLPPPPLHLPFRFKEASDAEVDLQALCDAAAKAPEVGGSAAELAGESGARAMDLSARRQAAEAELVKAFDVARAEEKERRGIIAIPTEMKESVRIAFEAGNAVGLGHKAHAMVCDGTSSRAFFIKVGRSRA